MKPMGGLYARLHYLASVLAVVRGALRLSFRIALVARVFHLQVLAFKAAIDPPL